jgi:formyl-CoA transferase/succinyl-CoA--D-citramalate CoA-transferase
VPKLDQTPGVVSRGAPLLGEHNEEVLGALPRLDLLPL